MTILEQMRRFADQYGKAVTVKRTTWRYYRLGAGSPVLWLTGGLRRAAPGFAFMERLAKQHTVIAPDYPAMNSVDELINGFDAILQSEGVDSFALGGQSYGGLLAQAYLAHRGKAVERLVLSSCGPVNYGKAWLAAEYALIALAYLLPEKMAMDLLSGGRPKITRLPEDERIEWRDAIDEIMQNELSRADVVSHFAVAADLIRNGKVNPGAFQGWTGRICVLSAENDPTQGKKDLLHYEELFGREVEAFDMGYLGHNAALFNPEKYVELIEQALS